MTRLARYLILRPLLTNLVLVLIVLIAGASLLRVQRQAYPRVDLGKVNITTIFPGASPEDVELNVTVKLEEALKEVSGIEKYISRSTENVSFIQVYIDPDADDPEDVKNDIRTAVDRVSDLPEEVEERPTVNDIKIDYQPVYEISLTLSQEGDMSVAGERLLRFHARQLRKKLLDLAFVSGVEEVGIRDREIQILLDRDKLAARYISFDEVIEAIRLNKLRVSGGNLESYTTETGIVTFSEFETPEDVANIIVRSSIGGGSVRIRDVGTVVDGFAPRYNIVKYQGRPGVSLFVTKKWAYDVIYAVDRIKAVIGEYRDGIAPPEIRFESTWDSSIETRDMLGIMYGNAALGLTLLVVILFLFLDRRIAFWTAAGIPLSIAIAIVLFPWLGITINSISLVGVIVVLGMIVDDAIIIAESIYRAQEEGLSMQESAVTGLANVVRPVLGTIVTTIIAFLPMYFIPGIVGDFSREIPTVVIIMLVASFIEATTILPAHLGTEHPGDGGSTRRSVNTSLIAEFRKNYISDPLRAWIGAAGRRLGLRGDEPPGRRLFVRMEAIYTRVLDYSLARPYFTSLLFLGFLLFGSVFGALFAEFEMFPKDRAYRMWILGQVPRGSNLDYTNRLTERIEGVLDRIPDGMLHTYKTFVGHEYDPGTDSVILLSSSFMTEVTLVPASERDQSAQWVRDWIEAEVHKIDPENLFTLSFYIDGGGPPVGQPVEIQIMGPEDAERRRILENLRTEMQAAGVIDINSDMREGKREIRLLPNYERIAESGLHVAQIASNIRTAFDGTVVTHLQTPDERIAFRVMLADAHTAEGAADPLRKLRVRNFTGNLIPIENLVRESRVRSPLAYFHYNSYRSNKLTGNVPADKDINSVYANLKAKFAGFEKQHPGYKLNFGGEAEESARFQNQMIAAILVAVVCMYFLLVVQFNSFSQPAMVILAIPFGLVGILLAFPLHAMPVSMLAMIGILGFTGVVVNDSLIMVDYINRLRRDDEGRLRPLSYDEFVLAVREGARTRLRPIALTTFTTVAGLIPTAYGFIGGFHPFISPMVMAMTWGLLVGTTSVLIIIPVFYVIHARLIGNAHHGEN